AFGVGDLGEKTPRYVGSTVKLWDVPTWKERATCQINKDEINSIAFAPNGKVIAAGGTGGTEGTVWLWDAETGKELTAFTGHTGGVSSVALTADGKTLASVAGKIKLWDVAKLTGKGK